MGEILAHTFDGQHVWIKDKHQKSKTKIDAMFFPATAEKFDKNNLRAEKEFKKLPTFIMCNPNAMFYQNMINYPHAFYLRFFLQKNINVLLWNYRGYARSKNKQCCQSMPSPENIREDSEAVLRFCRQDLGLRGKIGVYGRSLGGIATAHLAHYVDMVIVDRSFSNLYEVAYHKFHGFLAILLFKLGTWGWDSNNDVRLFERGIDSEERRKEIESKGFAPIAVAQGLSEPPQSVSQDEAPEPANKSCYKVVTCDVNDDIVILQGSLMLGAARRAAVAQQQNSSHYKERPLGIVDSKEATKLIETLDRLQEVDERLYHFVNAKIE